MKSSRATFVAIGALIALLASACFQMTMDWDFNEDGSGTLSVEAVMDSTLLQYEMPDDVTLEESCDMNARSFAWSFGLNSGFLEDAKLKEYELQNDNSCLIVVEVEFEDGWFEENANVNFSEMGDEWEVVLAGIGEGYIDDLFEVFEELGLSVDDFESDALEDTSFTFSVRLPGTPTDKHNADQIEENRFIWNFKGSELESMPAELRATSSATQSNYAWTVLVVVGAILALGSAYLLGHRRARAAQLRISDESSAAQTADSLPDSPSTDTAEADPTAGDLSPAQREP